MKVFISWSGSFSKECAELLSNWIKCTLQASEPWISSKDIDKGSLWFNEISDQLKDTKVGIVCLTKDNKEKPWILFESGALAKGISANRVCTFLINLKPSDVDGPLAQFNHTTPDKEGLKSLIITINKELEDKGLKEKVLDQVFETYWPSFKKDYEKIIKSEPKLDSANTTSRSENEILEEILYTTRAMDRRIRHLERKKEKNTFIYNKPEMRPDMTLREMLDLGIPRESICSETGITEEELDHYIQEVYLP